MEGHLHQAVDEAISKGEQLYLLEALQRTLEITPHTLYKPFTKQRKAFLWEKYSPLRKKVLIGMGIIILGTAIVRGLDKYRKLPFKKYHYHYVLSDTLYLHDMDTPTTILDTLFYGDKVLLDQQDSLHKLATVEKNEGTFWKASQRKAHGLYLLEEYPFKLYRSLLERGDIDNENLNHPWVRKALVDYFRSKNYIGSTMAQKDRKKFKGNDELQRWGFSGLQTPGSSNIFFRIDEQLRPKQRYVTRRYYAILHFGEQLTLNTDSNKKLSRFTALTLKNHDNGNQRFLIFEFNAEQEVVGTYSYDFPTTPENGDQVLKEIFKGFDEIPEITSLVKEYPAIIARSKNADISETTLFYYDMEKEEFQHKNIHLPAKAF